MRNLPLTLSCAVAIILASTTSLAKGSTSPSNIAEESQSLREGRTSPQQSHNLTLRQNQSSIPRNTSDKVDSPQMVCSATQATASSAPPAIYAAEQSCKAGEICSYYVCIPAYGDVTTEPASTSPIAEPTETADYPLSETVEVSSSPSTESTTSTASGSTTSTRHAATTSEAPAATAS
jgi:hypothetical protein